MTRLPRGAGLVLAAGLVVALVLWALLWGARPPAPEALPAGTTLDLLRIDKSDRMLTGFVGEVPVLRMGIALGFAPEGDKRREGDGKTPEGRFHIDRRNENSAYHLSLGIDYPRAEDRARAAAEGVDPGGDIFIHGQPNALPDALALPGDWTAGCIAVSNAQMRQLWELVPIGTPVEIFP
ncbi:murein L,D-transpeptidase family protein [Phaeobacter sp. HF9A]|uniref:L,D-transpeptidase family protein n=1 Tax=Phaeobacter sp. HF9A TaxID=2721561 RepID=UPI001431A578|nr:L,D-transpeptidase family protein [Phaeobacter sp. HF9A]NIZ15603.1 L,D-transpeptidase family protein [Phaeobacter sp. HF9A]